MSKSIINFFFIIICFTTLTSCSKKNNTRIEPSVQVLDSLRLYEAKQVDVPTPVGYLLVNSKTEPLTNEDLSSLCYLGGLSIKEATDFYYKNMELLGWGIHDFSNKNEGLLFCKKGRRTCAISIRSDVKEEKSKIHIFMHNNNINNSKDINSKKLMFN